MGDSEKNDLSSRLDLIGSTSPNPASQCQGSAGCEKTCATEEEEGASSRNLTMRSCVSSSQQGKLEVAAALPRTSSSSTIEGAKSSMSTHARWIGGGEASTTAAPAQDRPLSAEAMAGTLVDTVVDERKKQWVNSFVQSSRQMTSKVERAGADDGVAVGVMRRGSTFKEGFRRMSGINPDDLKRLWSKVSRTLSVATNMNMAGKGSNKIESSVDEAHEEEGIMNKVNSMGSTQSTVINSRLIFRSMSMHTSSGKSSVVSGLSAILASDHGMDDLIEMLFDRARLKKEVKILLKAESKARAASKQAAAKAAKLEAKQAQASAGGLGRRSSLVEDDQDTMKEALGTDLDKEAFTCKIKELREASRDNSANQLIIARLMDTLSHLSDASCSSSLSKYLRVFDCYTCYHPQSTFMTSWTLIYMTFVIYIATYGLYINTFSAGAEEVLVAPCPPVFTFVQWFDALVDGFFVIDFFFRCFLFGQVEQAQKNNAGFYEGGNRVLLRPSEVFVRFAKTSMSFDAITGFPIQWLIMALENDCSSAASGSGLGNVRFLRIARVSRILKIFNIQKVKDWVKKLKRNVPNTSLLQLAELLVGLLFLNHLWTCLTWYIKSTDSPSSFQDWQSEIGIHSDDRGDALNQYSLTFSYSMQTLFSINPFLSNTTHDAWFGTVTTGLSVFISATMLSKILDIWQSINKAQTERDNKINEVKRFMHTHGINGDLKDQVLDFFDFRFSITFGEFEKHLLEELPVDMRSKVVHQLFPNALKTCVLFSGVSDAFISHLVLRLARNPLRTMPGQVIVSQGMLGEEMFLLKSGTAKVSVFNPETEKEEIIKYHQSGTCFGEGSLWMEKARRTATVASVDFCQLYVLTAKDLEETLVKFPEFKPVIATNAMALVLRNRVLCPGLCGISRESADQLARRMCHQKVSFTNGEVICQAGAIPKYAYIIRKGRIEGGSARQQATVGFNELFCCRPTMDTTTAKGAVVAYMCSLDDLPDVFGSANRFEETHDLQKAAKKQYISQRSEFFGKLWCTIAEDLMNHAKEKSQMEELKQKIFQFVDNARSGSAPVFGDELAPMLSNNAISTFTERDDDLINSILLDAQTAAPEHKSSPRRGRGPGRHNGEGHNLYSSMEASRATGNEDEISLFVTSGQARRRASAIQVNSDCGEDSCRLSDDGGTSTSTVDELDATAMRHHRM